MTLKETSKLFRILKFVHKKISLNYDYFIVVTGDEGVGKSRGVFLNMIDAWYKMQGKKAPKECFGIDLKDFVKSLKKSEEFDFVGLDEAGDKLDTQDYYNHMNKILYQAYTVIREKKLLSVIVLPSIFDLNPRFRKRRVRMLINVKQRVDNKCKDCEHSFVGSVCPKCKSTSFKKGYVTFEVYNRRKLRAILTLNERRFVKSLHVGIQPTAIGTTGVYEGDLLEHYTKLKTQKIHDTLHGLQSDISSDRKDSPRRCPECGAANTTYAMRTNTMCCRSCGNRWQRQQTA